MTQEDRDLLLKDLSARLPYKVKVRTNRGPEIIEGLAPFCHNEVKIALNLDWSLSISDYTPYLRSMSSMTEEEKRHISKMMCLRTYDNGVVYDMTYPVYTPYYVMEDCLTYLRSIHVDYLGLIEKGLALEAPEGMYETKKQKN